MSFKNDWKPVEYNTVFDCSDGRHTVRIVGAMEKKSKNGNDMIEVTMQVDGIKKNYVEHYTAGENFDKLMTRFFDSFNISYGNWNYAQWQGRTAEAEFQHKLESYTDDSGQVKQSNKSRLAYLVVAKAEDDGASEEGCSNFQTAPAPASYQSASSAPDYVTMTNALFSANNPDGSPVIPANYQIQIIDDFNRGKFTQKQVYEESKLMFDKCKK